MSLRQYVCAIVGTGNIAHSHARAITELGPRMRLAAVVDVDSERATAFAEEWGTVAHPSLEDLLDHEKVDIVTLCTPPRVHAEQAALCLSRGVMTLVEKPPVLSLVELDQLRAAEAASTATVACIFQQRFGAAALVLRDWIAGGRLGAARVAQASTLWWRDADYFTVPWRGTWDSEGGGPTVSHGVHLTDLLLSLLGNWSTVTAVAGRLARPTETEDVAAALVGFESGAIATITNSLLSPRQETRLRIDFERATVELVYLYDYVTANWTLTPAPGFGHLAEEWAAQTTEGPAGHQAQFAAICDALDVGAPPPVTLADAAATLELVAGIYASAFEQHSVAHEELNSLERYRAHMDGGRAPWAPR